MTAPPRARFIGSSLTSLGFMVGVLLLPKDPTAGDPTRLGMTVLFLSAAASLVWCFFEPLDSYIAAYLADRFQGAGPEITHTAHLLRVNIMASVRKAAWLAMALVGCVSARILGTWPLFSALATFDTIWIAGSLLTFIALLAFPILNGRQISHAFNLSHQLSEQVATSDFKVRRRSPGASGTVKSDDGLRVLDGSRFAAGGFVWDWSDFYKNLIVFGQVGSGKTVCVLNPLLKGLVSTGAPHRMAAGLILDPKGDFYEKIARVMDACGRRDDLLVFDPDDPASFRWNPLDTPDSAEEVANRFGAVFAMQGQGGDKDAFFIQHSKMFFQSAITLLRVVYPDTIPDRGEIGWASGDLERLGELIGFAKQQNLEDEQARELHAALRYLEYTWMTMADDTRNSVNATLSTVLQPFSNPPFDVLMSGPSTLSLGDVIDQGKVLYVHLPIARRRLMAQTIGTLIKVEFARQVLQRKGKPRPSFFLCDEYQVFLTTDKETSDADFFERCRESNHANIVATQDRPALLQRDPQMHTIDHLINCCGTKVFLRNTDHVTNEWASKLFEERLRTVVSTGQSANPLHLLEKSSGASLTTSTSFQRVVRSDAFGRLGQPSLPENIRHAESIILFASRAKTECLNLEWPVYPL